MAKQAVSPPTTSPQTMSPPSTEGSPSWQALATANGALLRANPYPGRGIILGRSEDERYLVQLYWLMGRSANSRNRRFVAEQQTGLLRTAPFDARQVVDPSLIIYTAMREVDGHYLVSNGDHTDTLAASLSNGSGLQAGLRSRSHEPDAPHCTPRIAGGFHLEDGMWRNSWLALIKSDPSDRRRSLRYRFDYEALPPGYGVGLHTYAGDGEPLPSYQGEPRWFPLTGPVDALLLRFWELLHPQNRVALALKTIDLATPQAPVSRLVCIDRHAPDRPASGGEAL